MFSNQYDRLSFDMRDIIETPACGMFENPFRHIQKLSKRALKRLGDISAKIIIRSTPRESHRKRLEEVEEEQN